MSMLKFLSNRRRRIVDEIKALSKQGSEIEVEIRDKRIILQQEKEELERAILAYWANNGNLNGKCFKTVEFDTEGNDFIFRVFEGGRVDGNNRQIYLVEGFYPNGDCNFRMGRYSVEWRPIEAVDLDPKNIIDMGMFLKEREIYKAKWERIIRRNNKQ